MLASKIARNTMLDGLFDATSGWCFKIYSGAIPAHPEDSIGAAVLLCVVTNDGQPGVGLTWESSADGAIAKETTETWKGTILANGSKDFVLWCPLAYDGSENTTDAILQFDAGSTPDYDILVGSTTAVIGQTQEINYYTIAIPE